MANKAATEVRAKTADELKQALIDLKKEQFNLRFQKANGQLENTTRAAGAPRDSAHQDHFD